MKETKKPLSEMFWLPLAAGAYGAMAANKNAKTHGWKLNKWQLFPWTNNDDDHEDDGKARSNSEAQQMTKDAQSKSSSSSSNSESTGWKHPSNTVRQTGDPYRYHGHSLKAAKDNTGKTRNYLVDPDGNYVRDKNGRYIDDTDPTPDGGKDWKGFLAKYNKDSESKSDNKDEGKATATSDSKTKNEADKSMNKAMSQAHSALKDTQSQAHAALKDVQNKAQADLDKQLKKQNPEMGKRASDMIGNLRKQQDSMMGNLQKKQSDMMNNLMKNVQIKTESSIRDVKESSMETIKGKLLETLVESYGGADKLVEALVEKNMLGEGLGDFLDSVLGKDVAKKRALVDARTKNEYGGKDDLSKEQKNILKNDKGGSIFGKSKPSEWMVKLGMATGRGDSDYGDDWDKNTKAENKELAQLKSQNNSGNKTQPKAAVKSSGKGGQNVTTQSGKKFSGHRAWPVTTTKEAQKGFEKASANPDASPYKNRMKFGGKTIEVDGHSQNFVNQQFNSDKPSVRVIKSSQPQQQQKPEQKSFGWNRYTNNAEGRKQEDWDNDDLETGGIGNMRKSASEKPTSQGGTSTQSKPVQTQNSTKPSALTASQSAAKTDAYKKAGFSFSGSNSNSNSGSNANQKPAFQLNNRTTPNTQSQANKSSASTSAPQKAANAISRTTGTTGIGTGVAPKTTAPKALSSGNSFKNLSNIKSKMDF